LYSFSNNKGRKDSHCQKRGILLARKEMMKILPAGKI
jgi:hypothetical protein